MEYLSVNKGSGQAYGYVLYRTKIYGAATSHKISVVELQDNGVVSMNCDCTDNFTELTGSCKLCSCTKVVEVPQPEFLYI